MEKRGLRKNTLLKKTAKQMTKNKH